MNSKILKFQLGRKNYVEKENEIEIPIGAKILTVQVEYDIIYIYALVDPSNYKERRVFELYLIEQALQCDFSFLKYVDVIQWGGGKYFLFECI
jgi:hypothetical protein